MLKEVWLPTGACCTEVFLLYLGYIFSYQLYVIVCPAHKMNYLRMFTTPSDGRGCTTTPHLFHALILWL